MSKQVKWRRGTTEEHSTFIGAVGEVTVDTSKDTLVVHDGITMGGHSIPEPRDWQGFTDALLSEAGIVPSGQPDKLGASQRVAAMRKIFGNVGTVADIADGKFNVGDVVSVPDRKLEPFKIFYGGVADGYGILDAGSGKTAHAVRDTIYAYGGKCDGVTNDTANINAMLVARVGFPAVNVPSDTRASVSWDVPINGNNNKLIGTQTMLKPSNGDVWGYQSHSNVRFNGDGGVCVQFDPTSNLAGRHTFTGSQFTNGTIGVSKPRGNIGDRYKDCSFFDLDFGYHAVGETAMHPGAMVNDGSHFWFIRNAAIYINNTAGSNAAPTGGLVFNNAIIENSTGFGVYARGRTPHPVGEVPFNRLEFNGVWQEGALNTHPPVLIDGSLQQPRQYKFIDFADVTIRNSYLWDMELINSTVYLDNCKVDREFAGGIFFDIDTGSQVYADRLSCGTFGGFDANPLFFVNSWLQCNVSGAVESVLVRMPSCKTYGRKALINNVGRTFATAYTMQGTVPHVPTVVNDGVLSGTCCEYTILPGNNMIDPELFSPNYGFGHTWCVFTVSVKIMQGTLTGGAMRGNFEIGNIKGVPNRVSGGPGEWVTIRGYKKVFAGTGGDASMRFTNAEVSGNLVIRLADYSCALYTSEQAALQAVNEGECNIP